MNESYEVKSGGTMVTIYKKLTVIILMIKTLSSFAYYAVRIINVMIFLVWLVITNTELIMNVGKGLIKKSIM